MIDLMKHQVDLAEVREVLDRHLKALRRWNEELPATLEPRWAVVRVLDLYERLRENVDELEEELINAVVFV